MAERFRFKTSALGSGEGGLGHVEVLLGFEIRTRGCESRVLGAGVDLGLGYMI